MEGWVNSGWARKSAALGKGEGTNVLDIKTLNVEWCTWGVYFEFDIWNYGFGVGLLVLRSPNSVFYKLGVWPARLVLEFL